MRRGELLIELHPGVARLVGSPVTPEQAIAAAVLAAGPTAVASHRSAARLWEIERPATDPVDITVARSVTRRRLDGVVVHRPTDRLDMSVSLRAGTIRSTNLLRTLVDLGAVVGSVDEAVAAAVTSGAVTPRVLHRLVARHGRPGRSGVGALRRALAAWPLEDKPADSELELRMARLIQRYGLPPVVFHPPRIAGYEVDFLVVGTRVVLECDGWDFHGRTRDQDEQRAQRDLDLMAAGYLVFHFTWRQITRRPAWTADRIRSLLDTWAAAVPGPIAGPVMVPGPDTVPGPVMVPGLAPVRGSRLRIGSALTESAAET
jgi:hypothetical protein